MLGKVCKKRRCYAPPFFNHSRSPRRLFSRLFRTDLSEPLEIPLIGVCEIDEKKIGMQGLVRRPPYGKKCGAGLPPIGTHFMQRTYLTWPLPWLVITINTLLIWHLRHPFRDTLAESWFATISSLLLAADKTRRVSLDIWHDLDSTFHLSKKLITLF